MKKPRLRVTAGLVIGLMWLSVCSPVFALGNEVDTGVGVVTKLFRGIVNTATGWFEIPKQISLTWQESGAGPGMSWGFAKGIGWAVARTAVGAYEIVTFAMPIPEGYQPILQPEYVLSDLNTAGGGGGGESP